MTSSRSNEELHDLINSIAGELQESQDEPIKSMEPEEAAGYIDHTLLKLDATSAQIDEICEQAKGYKFKTVCIRLNYVPQAVKRLSGTSVGVACVIGFHEGTQSLHSKSAELSAAIKAGASEADAVLNRTYLQPLSDDGVNGVSQLLPDYISIFKELCVLRATAPPPTTLKLILETSQLSESEVVAASILAHYAGFDFIKTSSGFCGRGATIEDVRLMKRVAAAAAKKAGDRDPMQIKAAGGVKSFEDLKEMVAAGASRIGASAGVAIAEEAKGGKAAVGNSGGY